MLALALLLALQPAPADQTGATAPANPAPSSPAPAVASARPKMICKQEGATGSLLGGQRVCHTRAEWDEIAAQSSDSTRQLQQSSRPH